MHAADAEGEKAEGQLANYALIPAYSAIIVWQIASLKSSCAI